MATKLKCVQTNAPSGPFSHATVVGPWIFTIGTGGIDPKTEEVISDDVVEQTKQSLVNLTNILKACGASLQDIVKATVYLTDIEDYDRVNAVYLDALAPHRPARTCVGVNTLPKREKMKIEVIAYRE